MPNYNTPTKIYNKSSVVNSANGMSLQIGASGTSTSMDMGLKAPSKGIDHFTNSDALTSLELTDKERFDARGATKFLGVEFHPNAIKIEEDIAAIAYDEYTDINKFAIKIDNTGKVGEEMGMYRSGYGQIAYDTDFYKQWEPFDDVWALPMLDRSAFDKMGEQTIVGEREASWSDFGDHYFHNMFIIVEYAGTSHGLQYSSANQAKVAALAGKKQVFKYFERRRWNHQERKWITGKLIPEKQIPHGHFYWESGQKVGRDVLKLKIGNKSELAGLPQVPYVEENASDDVLSIFGEGYQPPINASWWASDYYVTWGRLNIKSIQVVKYTPVVECGKVDIYTRKSGNITGVGERGKATAPSHGLKDGDIIKISSALTSTGTNDLVDHNHEINGTRYVSVIDSDTIRLYKDGDMSETISTSTSLRPAVPAETFEAVWTTVGNVFSGDSQGWQYYKSLSSPTGRNGYTHRSFGYDLEGESDAVEDGDFLFDRILDVFNDDNNTEPNEMPSLAGGVMSKWDWLFATDLQLVDTLIPNEPNPRDTDDISYSASFYFPGDDNIEGARSDYGVESKINSLEIANGLLAIRHDSQASTLDALWKHPRNFFPHAPCDMSGMLYDTVRKQGSPEFALQKGYRFGSSIDLKKEKVDGSSNVYKLVVGERGAAKIPNYQDVRPLGLGEVLDDIEARSRGQNADKSFLDKKSVDYNREINIFPKRNSKSVETATYQKQKLGFEPEIEYHNKLDFADVARDRLWREGMGRTSRWNMKAVPHGGAYGKAHLFEIKTDQYGKVTDISFKTTYDATSFLNAQQSGWAKEPQEFYSNETTSYATAEFFTWGDSNGTGLGGTTIGGYLTSAGKVDFYNSYRNFYEFKGFSAASVGNLVDDYEKSGTIGSIIGRLDMAYWNQAFNCHWGYEYFNDAYATPYRLYRDEFVQSNYILEHPDNFSGTQIPLGTSIGSIPGNANNNYFNNLSLPYRIFDEKFDGYYFNVFHNKHVTNMEPKDYDNPSRPQKVIVSSTVEYEAGRPVVKQTFRDFYYYGEKGIVKGDYGPRLGGKEYGNAVSLSAQARHNFIWFNNRLHDLYPFVDSFGKAVAFDIIDGDVVISASCKAKAFSEVNDVVAYERENAKVTATGDYKDFLDRLFYIQPSYIDISHANALKEKLGEDWYKKTEGGVASYRGNPLGDNPLSRLADMDDISPTAPNYQDPAFLAGIMIDPDKGAETLIQKLGVADMGYVISGAINSSYAVYKNARLMLSGDKVITEDQIENADDTAYWQKQQSSMVTLGFRSQYYKAEKVGICLIAKDKKLLWGESHAPIFSASDESADFDYRSRGDAERSSYIYIQSDFGYSTVETIDHYDYLKNVTYLNANSAPVDKKECYLRDHNVNPARMFIDFQIQNGLENKDFAPQARVLSRLTGSEISRGKNWEIISSDRFGNNFKYKDGIVIANGYNIYNEFDQPHEDVTYSAATGYSDVNVLVDYIHIYELENKDWTNISKISASIDSEDSNYSYRDVLDVKAGDSLRNLGNINYSNKTIGSKTWDIDLTNRFVLVDDSIILKDPSGYSIFKERRDDADEKSEINSSAVCSPYLSFEEKFDCPTQDRDKNNKPISTPTPLVTYNYSNLGLRDNPRLNIYQGPAGQGDSQHTSGVCFFKVPIKGDILTTIESLTLTFEYQNFVADIVQAGGKLPSVPLVVLYKHDPRETIYPYYLKYPQSNPEDTRWLTQSFRGGAQDSYFYRLNSFMDNSDKFYLTDDTLGQAMFGGANYLAKAFVPKMSISTGTAAAASAGGGNIQQRFIGSVDISRHDVMNFLTSQDLIKSTTRTISETYGDYSVVFDDTNKTPYNSDVASQEGPSLIIGFLQGNVTTVLSGERTDVENIGKPIVHFTTTDSQVSDWTTGKNGILLRTPYIDSPADDYYYEEASGDNTEVITNYEKIIDPKEYFKDPDEVHASIQVTSTDTQYEPLDEGGVFSFDWDLGGNVSEGEDRKGKTTTTYSGGETTSYWYIWVGDDRPTRKIDSCFAHDGEGCAFRMAGVKRGPRSDFGGKFDTKKQAENWFNATEKRGDPKGGTTGGGIFYRKTDTKKFNAIYVTGKRGYVSEEKRGGHGSFQGDKHYISRRYDGDIRYGSQSGGKSEFGGYTRLVRPRYIKVTSKSPVVKKIETEYSPRSVGSAEEFENALKKALIKTYGYDCVSVYNGYCPYDYEIAPSRFERFEPNTDVDFGWSGQDQSVTYFVHFKNQLGGRKVDIRTDCDISTKARSNTSHHNAGTGFWYGVSDPDRSASYAGKDEIMIGGEKTSRSIQMFRNGVTGIRPDCTTGNYFQVGLPYRAAGGMQWSPTNIHGAILHNIKRPARGGFAGLDIDYVRAGEIVSDITFNTTYKGMPQSWWKGPNGLASPSRSAMDYFKDILQTLDAVGVNGSRNYVNVYGGQTGNQHDIMIELYGRTSYVDGERVEAGWTGGLLQVANWKTFWNATAEDLTPSWADQAYSDSIVMVKHNMPFATAAHKPKYPYWSNNGWPSFAYKDLKGTINLPPFKTEKYLINPYAIPAHRKYVNYTGESKDGFVKVFVIVGPQVERKVASNRKVTLELPWGYGRSAANVRGGELGSPLNPLDALGGSESILCKLPSAKSASEAGSEDDGFHNNCAATDHQWRLVLKKKDGTVLKTSDWLNFNISAATLEGALSGWGSFASVQDDSIATIMGTPPQLGTDAPSTKRIFSFYERNPGEEGEDGTIFDEDLILTGEIVDPNVERIGYAKASRSAPYVNSRNLDISYKNDNRLGAPISELANDEGLFADDQQMLGAIINIKPVINMKSVKNVRRYPCSFSKIAEFSYEASNNTYDRIKAQLQDKTEDLPLRPDKYGGYQRPAKYNLFADGNSTVLVTDQTGDTDIGLTSSLGYSVAATSTSAQKSLSIDIFNTSRKLRYTNPVLGIGSSRSASVTDNTTGEIRGTLCSSNQVLSNDTYYTTSPDQAVYSTEISKTALEINKKKWDDSVNIQSISSLDYQYLRSWDIQKNEFLPLLMIARPQATGVVDLRTEGYVKATGAMTLKTTAVNYAESPDVPLRMGALDADSITDGELVPTVDITAAAAWFKNNVFTLEWSNYQNTPRGRKYYYFRTATNDDPVAETDPEYLATVAIRDGKERHIARQTILRKWLDEGYSMGWRVLNTTLNKIYSPYAGKYKHWKNKGDYRTIRPNDRFGIRDYLENERYVFLGGPMSEGLVDLVAGRYSFDRVNDVFGLQLSDIDFVQMKTPSLVIPNVYGVADETQDLLLFSPPPSAVLPLYLQNQYASGGVPVSVSGPIVSATTGNVEGASVPSGVQLYISPPVPVSGNTTLVMPTPYGVATTPVCDYQHLSIPGVSGVTGSESLFMKVQMPSSGMSLYAKPPKKFGPMSRTGFQDLGLLMPPQSPSGSLSLHMPVDLGILSSTFNHFIYGDTVGNRHFRDTIASGTLYTQGPHALTGGYQQLHTYFGPNKSDNVIDGDEARCVVSYKDEAFDTSPLAEPRIENTSTNSLVLKRYADTSGLAHGYAPIEEIGSDIITYKSGNDYKFYFNNKVNESFHNNDDYLCVGSNSEAGREGAAIEIFTIDVNKQITFLQEYSTLETDLIEASLISSSSTIIEAYYKSIQISDSNRIAASVTLRTADPKTMQDMKYENIIFILEKDADSGTWSFKTGFGNSCSEISDRLKKDLGSSIAWDGEDLYYPQESALNGEINYRLQSDNYVAEQTAVSFADTDAFTPYRTNLNSRYLEETKLGFGHKVIIKGDLMFVSCPLLDGFMVKNTLTHYSLNAFRGAVFVFKRSSGTWSYTDTVYQGGYDTSTLAADSYVCKYTVNLFGYDIAYNERNDILAVGEPVTKKVYRYGVNSDGEASFVAQYSGDSDDIDYGASVDVCHSDIITFSKKAILTTADTQTVTHDNKGQPKINPPRGTDARTLSGAIYNLHTGTSFNFDINNPHYEALPYVPIGTALKSVEEKLYHIRLLHFSDNTSALMAGRTFNIQYGLQSNNLIRKLSLLEVANDIYPTLFIQGPLPLTNSLTLQIPPIASGTGSMSLSLPLRATGQGVNLFLDQRTSSGVLDMHIRTETSGVMPLTLTNYPVSGTHTAPLTVKVALPATGGMELAMPTTLGPVNQGFNLTMYQGPAFQSWPLFMKQRDPIPFDDGNGLLFVYGNTVSSSRDVGKGTLLTGGTVWGPVSNTYQLFMVGPPMIETSGALNMLIHNPRETGVASGVASLSVPSPSGWGTVSNTSQLYISSFDGSPSGNMNLMYSQKGVGGGDEVEGNVNMVLENKTTSTNINLVASGIYGSNNSVNLLMTSGDGVLNATGHLYIRGYLE